MSRRIETIGYWGVVMAIAASCGGAAPSAPATPSSAATGPGFLDVELVGAASSAQGVMRIKIRVAADGAVHKLAVYHRDASLVPEPVRAAAEARFPSSEVRYYESEIYADVGRVYEVEVATADGVECEVAAQADGTLLYSECKLPPDALDPQVKATVDRVVPGGTILEVETKEGPNLAEISVEVKSGEIEHYVRTTPTGELLGHTLRIPAVIEVPAP